MANRMILNETSYHGKGGYCSYPNGISCQKFQKAVVITDKELHKNRCRSKSHHLIR